MIHVSWFAKWKFFLSFFQYKRPTMNEKIPGQDFNWTEFDRFRQFTPVAD